MGIGAGTAVPAASAGSDVTWLKQHQGGVKRQHATSPKPESSIVMDTPCIDSTWPKCVPPSASAAESALAPSRLHDHEDGRGDTGRVPEAEQVSTAPVAKRRVKLDIDKEDSFDFLADDRAGMIGSKSRRCAAKLTHGLHWSRRFFFRLQPCCVNLIWGSSSP